MEHSKFVHLHNHTEYSLLDGASRLGAMVNKAKELKMPAIAITDHGSMYGSIDFYQKATAAGVKPIIGCEIYVAPTSRLEKKSHGIHEAAYHLTLLAKDMEGYKNLMKLVTIGHLEGFYYRPRVDKEVLQQYSNGLIAMSGCLKGEVCYTAVREQFDDTKKVIREYQSIFGEDNYYLELHRHGIPDQDKANEFLVSISKEWSVPLVATNDFHYVDQQDAEAHDVLMCVQMGASQADPNRMRFSADEFYLKSAEEMASIFSDVPQAMESTIQIAEKCNLELEFGKHHMPQYEPPEGESREKMLRRLCEEGIPRCYPDGAPPELKERLDVEMGVITKMGFVSYFLITWDFIHYAKENDIPVGPGRGSAAGSVIAFLLGITNIDPLKYSLIFERFLNPERVSMPDIDIDFCYDRRGEVINYVVKKYGEQNVAQIGTFGTMKAKAAIRDVGRVMDVPYSDVDKIAKLVPNELNITLKKALEDSPDLREQYEKNPIVTRIIDMAIKLEGCVRNVSTHAAGIVISEKPLTEYVPLAQGANGELATQYPMKPVEQLGLLKMDFLGLKTLTVISNCLKLIKETKGEEINIDRISMEDKKTFDLLAKGNTIGVFQLESPGMRDISRRIGLERFEHIVALVALFRPGPMKFIDDFIKRKFGAKISYLHPDMEPILEDTYGIMIYQEQVMKVANEIGGYSLGQADNLRRIMGKKIPEQMEQQREVFIKGAVEKGVNKKVADKIFEQMAYFAGYGFNKSHSAAYSLIAYQTAYLKANYPTEFMAALLTSEMGNTDKVVQYIEECKQMGSAVLPPDVNKSFTDFSIDDNNIRFGLNAIKNVGRNAVDNIVQVRKERGEFTSLYDFTEHLDTRIVNRKVLESLIKSGSMDSFGLNRSQLFEMIDAALQAADEFQKDRDRGQSSFFDVLENQDTFKKELQKPPNIPEWPEHDLLRQEKEMIGFYITGHPLGAFAKVIERYANCSVDKLGERSEGDEVKVGGIILSAKHTVTKRNNERMAILTVEDLTGNVDALVFPRAYESCRQFLDVDTPIFIQGKANLKDDQPKIIVEQIYPLAETQKRMTKAVFVNMDLPTLKEETLDSLKQVLKQHHGETRVLIDFSYPTGEKLVMEVDPQNRVNPTDDLVLEIEALLGEKTVFLKGYE